MNNKLVIILIIFFQILFINKLSSNEIQFNANEIEVIDEGNETIAKNGTAYIKKDKISLKVQLFSDDGNEVYNFADEGEKKEPKILGKSVGKKILELSKGKYIKKRWTL